MTRCVAVLLGGMVAGVGVAMVAAGDVIHLENGSAIEVEAWRDVGDAIEFTSGGGIIRIGKAEIRRIDGRTQSGDLRMRPAPPSAGATIGSGGSGGSGALDRPAAAKEMTDLLKQGEGLFGQTVLTAPEKATAFRRLGEKWQALSVPEALRDAHAQGQRVLQVAAEAFTAEGEGTAPDVKERVEAAKKGVQEAHEQVKKAGATEG